MPSKVLLFDGFNILMRGFYALPLLSTASGEYTNAVYGFFNIFFRFLDEERPDGVAVAFDLPQPTFRHERYGAYKGNRAAMPEELRPQIPLLRKTLAAMGVCQADCPGYEADDVLGTLAAQGERAGCEVVIVSGDRDLWQVATQRVKIRMPKTKAGKTEVTDYHAADVLEKVGVTPRAYIDVKALMGDASDNIPGVPGIGEVTATKIIAAYDTVENAIAHADEIKPKRAAENLSQYREQALLSKMLATIITDAPVAWNEDAMRLGDIFNENALAEFTRLEFKNFYGRFKKDTTAAPSCAVIRDARGAEDFFAALSRQTEAVSFTILAEGPSLLGMGFAPPGHPPVFVAPGKGFSPESLLALSKPWFESPSPKLAMDSKQERGCLRQFGIALNNVTFDAMLAGYVLNALKSNPEANGIAADYLGEIIPDKYSLLDNKYKKATSRRTMADLPPDTVAGYAGRAADVVARAYPFMRGEIEKQNQQALYDEIEMPLAEVLADMEAVGIRADRSLLMAYGQTLDEKIAALTGLIYDFAGEEFNILSPQQLGVLLFEKLGLKGTKKTKQGYSTAADVLEKLAGKHPVVPLILEYRTYAKLKSTYVDGLLPLIDPDTSRVHSTFHQALTATGRLSSAEPNLQNIPVRMPLGRQLRKVFIPAEGCVLVDADYSQIELRVLAHMAQDEALIQAFLEGQDIHRLTASQVFHTAPEDVTPLQRTNAKAVNFGIIYGISAFGLSEDLSIPKKEAERYIQGYFEKYPRVKAYMDNAVAQAAKDGYAATIFNRRRAMPELQTANFNLRAFGERVAMNMPIQGSAADIIKRAMINVARRLQKEGLQSKLILQVHDELLLEAPLAELDAVQSLVRWEMENAVSLSVPLVADVHTGNSWHDAK